MPVKLSTGDGTKVQDADPIKKDCLRHFSPVDGRTPGLAFVFYGSFQNFTADFCQKSRLAAKIQTTLAAYKQRLLSRKHHPGVQ
ncbi:MAG: hypothetical protein LH618_20515, partial [Saprospiraceae bacterium]|nr:hypothetical protein [Saprospiraceae bacterium]